MEIGYCAWDCGDENHTCTAWDGTGYSLIATGTEMKPNHNLAENCPPITKCQYRMKKIKSEPILKV
jgi:hypothetical protein